MSLTHWLPIIPNIQTGWSLTAFAIVLALELYFYTRK